MWIDRWKDIDSIVIEGLDKDRGNKAALLGFGLLGVGAKVKQTGVLIRTGDRELVFQMDGSEFDWKNGLRPPIQTHSEAADKSTSAQNPQNPLPTRTPLNSLSDLANC